MQDVGAGHGGQRRGDVPGHGRCDELARHEGGGHPLRQAEGAADELADGVPDLGALLAGATSSLTSEGSPGPAYRVKGARSGLVTASFASVRLRRCVATVISVRSRVDDPALAVPAGQQPERDRAEAVGRAQGEVAEQRRRGRGRSDAGSAPCAAAAGWAGTPARRAAGSTRRAGSCPRLTRPPRPHARADDVPRRGTATSGGSAAQRPDRAAAAAKEGARRCGGDPAVNRRQRAAR